MSPIFICCSSLSNTPICVPGSVLWKLFSLLLIFPTSSPLCCFVFFHLNQILIWFFHIFFFSLFPVLCSCFSSASCRYCSFVHFVSLLCHFFFFMESAVGGGLQCLDSALCLSACVCLQTDMLLTMWLSFIWQNTTLFCSRKSSKSCPSCLWEFLICGQCSEAMQMAFANYLQYLQSKNYSSWFQINAICQVLPALISEISCCTFFFIRINQQHTVIEAESFSYTNKCQRRTICSTDWAKEPWV